MPQTSEISHKVRALSKRCIELRYEQQALIKRLAAVKKLYQEEIVNELATIEQEYNSLQVLEAEGEAYKGLVERAADLRSKGQYFRLDIKKLVVQNNEMIKELEILEQTVNELRRNR
jgi:uncharacterized coiled-coil DUF342 family protein